MIRRRIIETVLIAIIGVTTTTAAVLLHQHRARYEEAQRKPIQDRLPQPKGTIIIEYRR